VTVTNERRGEGDSERVRAEEGAREWELREIWHEERKWKPGKGEREDHGERKRKRREREGEKSGEGQRERLVEREIMRADKKRLWIKSEISGGIAEKERARKREKEREDEGGITVFRRREKEKEKEKKYLLD